MSARSSPTNRYDPEQFFGKPGTIYVLAREHVLPGCFKIGLTTRTVAERVLEANRIAAKMEREFGMADYHCVFAIETVNCGRAEQMIHTRLATYRRAGHVNGYPLGGQEWFKVDLPSAIATITDVVAQLAPAPTVEPVTLAASERELDEHAALIRTLVSQLK